MKTPVGTMMRLTDSDQVLADPEQDIRGRTVVDSAGNEIGKVRDLLIDTERNQVRLVRVEHGGLFGVGGTSLFVPVEAVGRVTGDTVAVDRSRVEVAEAPEYDPELVAADQRLADLYLYYGYLPYWTPGYVPKNREFFR